MVYNDFLRNTVICNYYVCVYTSFGKKKHFWNKSMYQVHAADRHTEFSCQTSQVRFMIYLPILKFGCPQKCIYA